MIQIENFFIDDKFYSDLEEVLEDCFDGNISSKDTPIKINELKQKYTLKRR